MKIEAIYQIKGRGTVLGCSPTTQPHQGSILRHADGRVWLITGVEGFCLPWFPGRSSGLLIRPASEGQAEPVEGDEVEMVEPLTLATLLAEAEHNVRTLRAALAVAERAASLRAGEVVEGRAAATATTRGSLINALASAGAARVEAEARLKRAETAHKQKPKMAQREALAAAQVAASEAREAEAAARAALDAWEKADREADPCPGSRRW